MGFRVEGLELWEIMGLIGVSEHVGPHGDPAFRASLDMRYG